jgi:hypothetical protein
MYVLLPRIGTMSLVFRPPIVPDMINGLNTTESPGAEFNSAIRIPLFSEWHHSPLGPESKI